MIACGAVRGVRAGLIEIEMPALPIGSGVRIVADPLPVYATIVGLDATTILAAAHGRNDGVACNARVFENADAASLPLGIAALGRAIDAAGTPLDEGPPLRGPLRSVNSSFVLPCDRRAVDRPLWTGVKAIDALLTIGRGARVGIFGAPGAGKSTLLETIVCGVQADAVVIGLVGERGREAQEWIGRCDCRTTIVCATSDRAPSDRVRAAHVALAQAQALAYRGLHVLVLLDSLARYAAALREIGLATGESVGRGGYPPSVFAEMARLVERAGSFTHGSITLLATVLNDGDDRDPVSESARSLLDGHLQLTSKLADAGRFPAIDVLASASRTMGGVVGAAHADRAQRLRGAIALLEQVAEARSLGIEPQDVATRAAIAAETSLELLLRQGRDPVSPARTLAMLSETADILGEPHGHHD